MPQDATIVGAKELSTKELCIYSYNLEIFLMYKLEYFDVPPI
jgi:hypothetical protein